MQYKSSILDQASGSIGGTTFSRNRYGSYVRPRSLPVNPNSAPQNQVRENLRQATILWGSLNATQRNQWAAYADNVPKINKLGDTINLLGFNWFVGSVSGRIQAGLAPVLDGPGLFKRPAVGTLGAMLVGDATQQFGINVVGNEEWADEDGAALVVSVSHPTNPTVNFYGGPFRYIGKVLGNSTTPPTGVKEFNLPFGVTAGQRMRVRFRVLRADGRYSSWITYTLTVN